MGFNSAFKGLNELLHYLLMVYLWTFKWDPRTHSANCLKSLGKA